MISPRIRSAVIASLILLSVVNVCTGQEAKPADLGPKVLPSIATMNITRKDGQKMIATAFLALKDGVLVMPLHTVRDAARITAVFPNGEEFDCPGLIDKDERRNLALIRVRSFGRPLLKIGTAEPAVGDKLLCPVNKDGAFGVVEASVAEIVVKGGMKFYRLAGAIPPGNSGAPLVDARGEVIGVHVTLTEDGKDSEMALPSAYIMGLEVSLPVQPWTATTNSGGTTASAPALPQNDAADEALVSALEILHDYWASYTPLSEQIYRMTRYSSAPIDLTTPQSKLEAAATQLVWLKPADPLREKLTQVTAQLLAKEKQALEYDMSCWSMNKDAPPSKHIPAAEEAARRATALFSSIPAQLAAMAADFRQLAQGSPAFMKALPTEMRYTLGVENRKSALVLGVYIPARNPFQILGVVKGTLADKVGLRGGDTIVSAGGLTFKAEDDMQDFVMLLEQNPGGILEVNVSRFGKATNLRLKIPPDLSPYRRQ